MPKQPFSTADFQSATGVSRETLDRLRAYADLLARWQRRINLVGARTLPDLWRRHMLDSAQLLPLAPGAAGWLDLGSGAGFPGLVLAIMGARDVHLVESDRRKSAFLREAARVTETAVTLHSVRIEDLEPWPVAAITARALAPLRRLLDLAASFVGPETVCLFPKGLEVDKELTEATKYWTLKAERIASASDRTGCILRIKEMSRV